MGVYLPRWVWVGAGLLACVAGMVNVVGYLGFEHQAVTHLTGTTTLLGGAIGAGDVSAMARFGGVMLAFVGGSALSGMLIQDSTLRLGRRYGVALVLESTMLFAAIPLFMGGNIAGPLLAAAACGLQNAMATTYSGAVIRTSHLSGMFTDLGIGLGHAMRGMPLQTRRLLLCALIISCFLLGAVLGALLFLRVHYLALAVPATLTGVVGLCYAGFRQWQRLHSTDHA
ncbi:MAG: YoaK family protein [Thermomonas sp.]